VEGTSEDEVFNKAIQHAYEVHAIKPEEMTSDMKVKIQENIRDA